MLRQEARAARDVERSCRRQGGEHRTHVGEIVVELLAFPARIEPLTEVPVVVLGRSPVVVGRSGRLTHRVVGYAGGPPRVRAQRLRRARSVGGGRDRGRIERAGARALDTHVDGSHHRAVITLVGEDEALERGLVAGIDEAADGSTLAPRRRPSARRGGGCRAGRPSGRRRSRPRGKGGPPGRGERGGGARDPGFLDGEVAGGRRPAFFRRGGLDELARRNDAGELAPDFGPRRLDPGTGAVLLGVRKPLVAFNLELRGSIEVARAVAAAVRASSGGLTGVQALALSLGGEGSRSRRTSSTSTPRCPTRWSPESRRKPWRVARRSVAESWSG